MTDRSRLLDRLSKLLALAGSPSAHEAAAARSLAAAFMARHGLTRQDVEEHDAAAYHELSMGAVGWNATWRFALATVAARHCGAEAIALQAGRLRKVKIAGTRGDVERASVLYGQLLGILEKIERQVGSELEELVVSLSQGCGTREASDSFRRGAVLGIALRLAREGSRSDPVSGESATAEPGPSADQGILARATRQAEDSPSPATVASERLAEKYEPERRDLDLDDVGSPAMFELGRDVAAASVGVDGDGRVYLKKWRK
jgi:hypothetical protein